MCRIAWVVLLVSLMSGRTQVACAATPQEIRAAIDRGVRYLQSIQNADGTFRDANRYGTRLGGVALAGLALRAGGLPANDPCVQSVAEFVCTKGPRDYQTYDVALSILFLDSTTRDKNGRQLRGEIGPVASKRLRSGRILSGIQARDSELIVELGQRLLAGQGPGGTWSYSLQGPSDGDHSNTQFGVLGLWVACQHGLDGYDGLKRCAGHFRGCQTTAGGWGYVGRITMLPQGFGGFDFPGLDFAEIDKIVGGETPSMTCAGLIALATDLGAQSQLTTAPGGGKFRQQQGDEQVDRAMKLLERYLQGDADQRDADIARRLIRGQGMLSNLYFLWSLERVGVLYARSKIGEVEWHPWGADILLGGSGARQNADGSWRGNYGTVVDTSFALLFLSRASVSPELTEALASQFGDGPHGLRAYLPAEKPMVKPVAPAQDDESEPAPAKPAPSEPPPRHWSDETTPQLLASLAGATDPTARKAILAELEKRRPTYAEIEDELPAIRPFLSSRNGDAAAAARAQLENAFQRAPMSHCVYWLGQADAALEKLIWEQVDGRIRRADASVKAGYRDVAVKVLKHEQFSAGGKAAALELLARLKDTAATGPLIELLPRLPTDLWPKAGEVLRDWTGEAYGPRPGDGAAEIAAALEQWRKWWDQERRDR